MLKYSASVYVPSTYSVNTHLHPLIQERIAQKLASDAARIFGGASVGELTGYYTDEQGKLVVEPILFVRVFTNAVASLEVWATSRAQDLARVLKQESVAVEWSRPEGVTLEFVSDSSAE